MAALAAFLRFLLPLLLCASAAALNTDSLSSSPLFFRQPRSSRGSPSPRLEEWAVSLGPASFSPPSSSANACPPLRVNPAAPASPLAGSSADASGGGEGKPGSRVCAGPDIHHTAGYFKLNRTHDSRLFFLYFESRSGSKHTDPLVLWMTGGPGCSSELAVLYENGPWKINRDNASLSWNPYGWDLVSNIVFVDQPVNTGFSYSHDPRDMRHTEAGVAQDMYEFLQEFLTAHPELTGRPFFVTGESYGGKYVPAVAYRVLQGNEQKEGAPINLQGIAIGNGYTVPLIQDSSYPDFVFLNGLINQTQLVSLKRAIRPCYLAAKACGTQGWIGCFIADYLCGLYTDQVLAASGSGHLNRYDIREDCSNGGLCYDFSAAAKFLGLPWVKEALGVPLERVWQECSPRVERAMKLDLRRDGSSAIKHLLEAGVRTLLYAGDKDYICNWLGNLRWVQGMEWSGQAAFLNAVPRAFFIVPRGYAFASGLAIEAGPLSFLKVFDSGHLVPMNQPEAALNMLLRFLHNVTLGDSPASPGHLRSLRNALAQPLPPAAPPVGLRGVLV